MLYNQEWDKKVKADPFSLESLIAWLEKQPADAQYDWGNCYGKCLIGRYLAESGIKWSAERYIQFLNYDKRVAIAGTEPFTFGAALTRARAALTAS